MVGRRHRRRGGDGDAEVQLACWSVGLTRPVALFAWEHSPGSKSKVGHHLRCLAMTRLSMLRRDTLTST